MNVREQQILDWLRPRLDADQGTPLGAGYQATVRLHEGPYGKLIVKSAVRKGLRSRAAKISIVREHAAYERLRGVEGVPASHGLVDGEHLVLDYIEGPSLRAYERQIRDRERFFADLLETIEAVHAAGVAHGDLKRKDNTLVGPGERPYIIDFGIACLRKEKGGRLNRFCFDLYRQLDYNAWTKLKYGRSFEGLSAEDAKRYKPLWIERIARWLRIPWQAISLRRPRQRWRKRRAAKPD